MELETCNLRGAAFAKVDFGRAFGKKVTKWAGAMKGCNLEFADLSELRMPHCDLNNSRFREAVLFDADLEGADLRGCDFVQALTSGAKLARADMRGADLGGINLIELGSFDGLTVSADQQHQLLTTLGV
jgi:fluoroquinolone resistance protein